MDVLIDVLRDFGFPVAVCAVLFVFVAKQNETHRTEVNELRIAIDSMRLVLQQFLDRLGDRDA